MAASGRARSVPSRGMGFARGWASDRAIEAMQKGTTIVPVICSLV
eukprot:CAMPEP_0174322046 /NCGR_PEP_ID=MMETSP0810-20121108/10774_1 /TAXON_ID=73025 ORGANISM="Eutreptiella gymnastica-like, Strain CCMP1594" /NCGR_SAMPLE_ID=MMETSP0810 /ASSEMBLY_ACC=CAM_ASM_000659 /LENGTH=44 /DNA_ID= /DNA_START= /DNA_END= /DNA_ORIENTATION=